jgi:hypothetical protein
MSRNLAGVALDPVVNEAATVRRLCLDYTRQGSFCLPHHVLLALLDLVGSKASYQGQQWASFEALFRHAASRRGLAWRTLEDI